MRTRLLSLNDDALLAIFSYLYGRDALAVALTSKRLHDLAIPRVAAIALCHYANLQWLCDYMLQGPRPRVRYLEVLDVRLPFLWFTFRGETSGAVEQLVAHLFEAAQNTLRQLTLELPALPHLESFKARARIGAAMVSMRNLVDLHLRNINYDALALFQMLSGSLIRLRIWYDKEALQTTLTEIALLRALAKQTRLERLEIRRFRPSALFNVHSVTSPQNTRLASLRHLVIAEGNAEATLLADLFPQLVALAVLDMQTLSPPPTMSPHTTHHWPPLKQLHLPISLAVHAQHRVGRVESIELLQPMQYENLRALQGPLDTTLRTASPVRLSLTVYADSESATMGLLASVLEALPRLCTLSLRMQRDRDVAYIGALEEQWLVSLFASGRN